MSHSSPATCFCLLTHSHAPSLITSPPHPFSPSFVPLLSSSCFRSRSIHPPVTNLLFCPSLLASMNVYPLNLSWPLTSLLTVIQDVDSSSLEANYQSFASLMEQRLAELFLVAGRQGSRTGRSRRATTVGGYTVQVGGNGMFLCQCVCYTCFLKVMTSLLTRKIHSLHLCKVFVMWSFISVHKHVH